MRLVLLVFAVATILAFAAVDGAELYIKRALKKREEDSQT